LAAYEIPLSSTDQVFQIPLGGITYTLTSKWCAPMLAWTLDIADANGVALVSGIPLVTGVDLLEQYQYLGIAGQLVAQTDGDTFAVPTQSNLGVSGRLYFVIPDGAVSTPAPEIITTTPLMTRGVQNFSPNLEAIAGLTVSADTVAYFTGGVTAALTGFTAAGRTLASAASTAAQRIALSLVVGTNVQAWDADLDALAALTGTSTIYYRSGASTWTAVTVGALLSWTGGTLNITDAELVALAGLTSAANQAPYFTGSGTAALTSLTASGRAVIALTGSADKVPFFTGSGTAGTADFTVAGRNIVGAVDAAAQQVVLSLVVGTNVQAHSNDLDAVALIATTGFVYRIGAASYTTALPAGALLAILEDHKASGTNGGTFTAGAWQTRDLNTEVFDRLSIFTISGNQFTISAAGTYEISWSAPSYLTASNQSRLYNVTSSTDIGYGSSQYTAGAQTNSSTGHAILNTTGSNTFEIQHRCANTEATNGFGVATGLGVEVYTTVIVRQG
jgi:hypothetical protein